MMGAKGKDVLYAGDHIFGDVLKSKKLRGRLKDVRKLIDNSNLIRFFLYTVCSRMLAKVFTLLLSMICFITTDCLAKVD